MRRCKCCSNGVQLFLLWLCVYCDLQFAENPVVPLGERNPVGVLVEGALIDISRVFVAVYIRYAIFLIQALILHGYNVFFSSLWCKFQEQVICYLMEICFFLLFLDWWNYSSCKAMQELEMHRILQNIWLVHSHIGNIYYWKPFCAVFSRLDSKILRIYFSHAKQTKPVQLTDIYKSLT